MLYHWIGKPEKSNARIHQIVADNFNDSPTGIPGNDDGGAMSAWLAFHMMGLYPNAGHDYYLIHEPMIGCTIMLPDGKSIYINKVNGDKIKFYLMAKNLKVGKLLISNCSKWYADSIYRW